MLIGLDKFSEFFADYKEQYMLIGGAACDLLMEEAGLHFRSTKDLDLVLCAEVIDRDFAQAFWQFIEEGQYQNREKANGKKEFYRFYKTQVEGFPQMLELCARVPDLINLAEGSQYTPIPVDGEVSSLSALVLDDDYHQWILKGRVELENVSLLDAEHLLPLKALAWLNLSERKANGEEIDSKKINKHRKDIFRLYQILDPERNLAPPQKIKDDLKQYLEHISRESIDPKSMGISSSLDDVIQALAKTYGL